MSNPFKKGKNPFYFLIKNQKLETTFFESLIQNGSSLHFICKRQKSCKLLFRKLTSPIFNSSAEIQYLLSKKSFASNTIWAFFNFDGTFYQSAVVNGAFLQLSNGCSSLLLINYH